MNSEEFTKFLNDLREEYNLPPLPPTGEMADSEEWLTKENRARLRPHEDLHT